VLAAVMAVAALAGLGIGIALAGLVPASEPSDPASPSTGATPEVTALEIFDRPQQPEDVVAPASAVGIAPESIRALINIEALQLETTSPFIAEVVYAGLSAGGQPCLLVATATGRLTSTCVSRDEFARSGLQLRWSSALRHDPAAAERYLHTAIWTPDGEASMGSERVAPPRYAELGSVG
jgi:hypothetical protein